MSIHRSRLLSLLCLLAILSSYGCDNNGRTDDRVDGLGPSPISFRGFGESPVNFTDFFSRGVTLQPASISPQRVAGAVCPTRPPFLAPIRIVATGNGASDLFLTQLQMRFVDRTGVVAGLTTIGRSELAELFGSTRIPPLGTRAFPFSFPFGCVGQPVGTLTAIVFAGDAFGREARTALTVSVR